jgi:hypothetical protein
MESFMNTKINTKQAFEIWEKHSFVDRDHLSLERLYEFSLTDGLKNAQEYEIQHLSLCPICLDKWEIFCLSAQPFAADDYDKDLPVLSCGFLKAASSGFTEPLYIRSDCKKFMLGIFPEIDNPAKGMAVLETIDEKKSYDDMEATIMDAKGKIVLKNIIKHGRAATKIEILDTLDLSKWTIVLIHPSGEE